MFVIDGTGKPQKIKEEIGSWLIGFVCSENTRGWLTEVSEEGRECQSPVLN